MRCVPGAPTSRSNESLPERSCVRHEPALARRSRARPPARSLTHSTGCAGSNRATPLVSRSSTPAPVRTKICSNACKPGSTRSVRGSARIVNVRGAGGQRTAKRVLLLFCFAILALAFAVHLAFLVLLVPVGGAMSFLLWTGQDRAWRRMGARRRFESLRLEVPAAWTEDAVRERRDALSLVTEGVRERASIPAREDDEAEEARLSADLDTARSDLHEALAAAGLAHDRLDQSTEARMRALARAWRAEQALQGIVEDLAGERAGAGEIRESIYRKLAREGEASPDGDASVDALEAGVERTNRR